MSKSIFLLGTGFIGGSVLAALLAEKKHTISALCRDPKKVAKLEELGVRPVQGELSSDEVISKEAAEADVRSLSWLTPIFLTSLRSSLWRMDRMRLTDSRAPRSSCTSRPPTTSPP